MDKHIFLSHAARDAEFAARLCRGLEAEHLRCWLAPRDIVPGESYVESIVKGVEGSATILFILSEASNESRHALREITLAAEQRIPVLTLRIEDVRPSGGLDYYLGLAQFLDVEGMGVPQIVARLKGPLEGVMRGGRTISDVPEPERPASDYRGYVFVSYVRADLAFVERLIEFFNDRGYGFWEYHRGDRNYHGVLYRELEEQIEKAKAFVCIISDDWRESDWVASEYIYAKDSRIPIFVIQAKALSRPVPLLLNLHPRIDMSDDYEKAVAVLDDRLRVKGL